MKLRGRSQELEDMYVPTVKAEKALEAHSNASEQTASQFELHSNPSITEPLSDSPKADKPLQAPAVPMKKKGRRKRKSAEEKAANVRARNRRAQQAFRKRQKVLSQEKNENMASLVEEVDELRETNRVLQNTIDELMQRLEDQEMRLEGMNSHNNMLINTRMQTHARPRDTLYEENIPQMLDDAAVPDLMAEDPVPDLLHGLSFGEGF